MPRRDVAFSVLPLDGGTPPCGGASLWCRCAPLRDRVLRTSSVALASASWSCCSIAMTLLNKWAVERTAAPLALVLLQMAATVCLAAATRDLRFGEGALLWAALVPPLFAAMMLSSILALHHVSVGSFVVVRNMGPLVTLGVETLVHRPDNLACDSTTIAATLAIALGVAMYEFSNIRFSAIGMFFLLANLLFSCAERMLQRHLLAVRGVSVSKPGLMLINNAVGAAFTLLIIALFQETAQLHHLAIRMRRTSVLTPVVASCFVGALISYSGLWLQSLVTATSFMVLGCFNKVAVIIWGIVFMKDASSPIALLGAMVSIFGCYLYSRAK
ncbi:hypothetical protein AB1Y20_018445 [Prymnesium parvum]|uniref:Sugar phosphate transporter domain-containing protein n=1 Tax=Prymnesium parvum TaxID=97485 RepID=A0AB34JRN0_PRYPA